MAGTSSSSRLSGEGVKGGGGVLFSNGCLYAVQLYVL